MTIRAVSGGWIKNGRGSAGGASLSLNFLNGITDFRITYSGGTNGTRVNEAGVIVAATTPRFDYNPVTLAARGLLVEEARTNLVLESRDLNTSPWLRGASLSNLFTVTTDALLGPDGVGGVAKFVTGAITAEGLFARAPLSMPAATYSVAPYIYVPVQAGVTNWSLVVDAQDTGDFGQSATFTTFGQWVRAPLSLTTTGTRTYADFNIRRNGVAPTNGDGFTFYVCCAQIEAGSFPTSYIPTTTAAVTRTADSAVMTGADFSRWYNQSEGTFVVSSDQITTGNANQLVAVEAGDGTNNELIQIATQFGATNFQMLVQDGGVGQFVALQAAQTAVIKRALAYKVNDFASCVGGATPVTDASGTIPTVTSLGIGMRPSGVSQLNGHIQTIQYFPRRVSNTQLQAMTL